MDNQERNIINFNMAVEFILQHLLNKELNNKEEVKKALIQIRKRNFDDIIENIDFSEIFDDGDDDDSELDDLLDEAYDLPPDEAKRIALNLLEKYPNKPEVYACLANFTEDFEEKKKYLEDGMRSFEEDKGDEYFEKHKGAFGDTLDDIDYLNLKESYIELLVQKNLIKEAIKQAEEYLQLDGQDRAMVRYLLAPYYLEKNQLKEFEDLYESYKDDNDTEWLYLKAVYEYKKNGAVNKTKQALQRAFRANENVIDIFLDIIDLDDIDLNEENLLDYEPGDKYEAILLLHNINNLVEKTKGLDKFLANEIKIYNQIGRYTSPI